MVLFEKILSIKGEMIMFSGKIEDILRDDRVLADILKNREEKRKKSNPLVVALTIVGAFTVVFALIYSFCNLVSGNAYKDVDDDEEEFEEEDEKTSE